MERNYLSKERNYWLKVFLDGIFLASAFLSVFWLKRGDLHINEPFRKFLPLLFLSWLLVTVFSKKFKKTEKQDFFSLLKPYWQAAIFFVLFLTLSLYLQGWIDLSRIIIFGTVAFYLALEIFYLAIRFILLKGKEVLSINLSQVL